MKRAIALLLAIIMLSLPASNALAAGQDGLSISEEVPVLMDLDEAVPEIPMGDEAVAETSDVSRPARPLDSASLASLDEDPDQVSVTVPFTLPVSMSKSGEVSSATNAGVVNRGSAPVFVDSIQVEAVSPFQLVGGDYDFAAAKVNAKTLMVSVDGVTADPATGSVPVGSGWAVAPNNGVRSFSYLAQIPAQENKLNTDVARITFTVTSFSITGPDHIDVGGEATFTVTGANGNVVWSTSNSGVATVNANGKVTGKGNGEVAITATCGGVSVSKNITVGVLAPEAGIDWEYTTNGDTITLKNYIGNDPNVVVHNKYAVGSKVYSDVELIEPPYQTGAPDYPFNTTSYGESLKSVSIMDGVKAKSLNNMFRFCSSLTDADISGLDISDVNTMRYMFYACAALSKVNVSGLDTQNVTIMESSFDGCQSLVDLDLSSWDTSNVKYMGSIFSGCSSLTNINLSGWDTSNVKSMGWMFSGCSNLASLDLSDWDTSNVEYMNNIFSGCNRLVTVTLGNKFTFNGSGPTRQCNLPTPDPAYIPGADGYWYTADGTRYAPDEIPNNTAATYYAVNPVKGTWREMVVQPTLTLDIPELNTSDGSAHRVRATLSDVRALNILESPEQFAALFAWGTDFSKCSVLTQEQREALANAIPDYDTWETLRSTVIQLISPAAQFLLDPDNALEMTTDSVLSAVKIIQNAKLNNTGLGLDDLLTIMVSGVNQNEVEALLESGMSAEEVADHVRGEPFVPQPIPRNSFENDYIKVEIANYSVRSGVEDRLPSISVDFDVTWIGDTAGTSSYKIGMANCDLTVVGLVNNSAPIEDASQNWEYTTNGDTITLTKYIGADSNIAVHNKYQAGGTTYNNVQLCEPPQNTDRPRLPFSSEGWEVSEIGPSTITVEEGVKPQNNRIRFLCCYLNNLTSADLSGLDVSGVTDMFYLFHYCYSLADVNVSGWDTSNVTNMESAFSDCKLLTTIDLSSWDLSNVTNANYMFRGCSQLKTIYVKDWSAYNKLLYSLNADIPSGCSVIVGSPTSTASLDEPSYYSMASVDAEPDLAPPSTPEPVQYQLTISGPSTVEAGYTTSLAITRTPEDDAIISWSSSDEAIATVNELGMITGVAAGEVTISAQVGETVCQWPMTVTGVPDAGEAWEYRVEDDTLILTRYIGESAEVIVYARYQANGAIYDTIALDVTVYDEEADEYVGPFAGRNDITLIIYEYGVALPEDADSLYEGCDSLTDIILAGWDADEVVLVADAVSDGYRLALYVCDAIEDKKPDELELLPWEYASEVYEA